MTKENEKAGGDAERTPVPTVEKWPKVKADYHGALIRLITMRDGKSKAQYLLFGFVELFPHDIKVPDDFTVGDAPFRVPSYDNLTLAASARRVSVADALSWYEDAARGEVVLQAGSRSIKLVAPLLGVEPILGRFSVDEEVPFAPHWHDCPRIHRLVPMQELDAKVKQLRSSTKAREWLAADAGFDSFEYEEWLGSISLLAPDPLLSGVGNFTFGRAPDGSERAVYKAIRRRYEAYPEEDARALTLISLHRRPSGWIEMLPRKFDEDGIIVSNDPEPLSEMGYAVVCPQRGLLRMSSPKHWMSQINVGIGVVDAVVDVEVPASGHRKPGSRYKSAKVRDVSALQVGEALPRSAAIRVVELQSARLDRIRAETAPQKLFGISEGLGVDPSSVDLVIMRQNAEAYVANLVTGARHRVIFVDPDFGLREYQNYALRVRQQGVAVKVLTSSRLLRSRLRHDNDTGDDTHDEAPPARDVSSTHSAMLRSQRQLVESRLGAAPQIFVMRGGNRARFHDRYLVVDDIVWVSGPSFNELGERIGLISRAHDSTPIVAAIERELNLSKSLEDWMASEDSTTQEDGEANAAS
ncbi:MAG: VPA1262 family N-terminal domain-containing protein [Aliidongia sp.]